MSAARPCSSSAPCSASTWASPPRHFASATAADCATSRAMTARLLAPALALAAALLGPAASRADGPAPAPQPLDAKIGKDCELKGKKLYGKVKVVDALSLIHI